MLTQNTFNKLISIGIYDELNERDTQVVRVANTVYVVGFFTALIMGVVNNQFGHPLMALVNLIHASVFVVSYVCSYYKAFEKGVTIGVHGTLVTLFLYSSYIGVEGEIDLYLFSVIVFVLFVYGKKDAQKKWYFGVLSMMVYLAMHFTRDVDYFPDIIIESKFLEVHRVTAFMFNIVICGVASYIYKLEQSQRERKIREAKESTELLLKKKITFWNKFL